ncbi:MAG: hypothetical protein Q4C70_07720 [Planctomycetia bacterium]|nr:hypothetical protein [Planctomycetia bacterium]
MANFSKKMQSQCVKMLKFIAPVSEKLADPDYVIPGATLDVLEQHIKEIVDLFMNADAEVKREFRTIADDAESLRRLGDLIRQFREGYIQISMKTTVTDVQKRVAAIKTLLNSRGGRKKSGNSLGCILVLLILAGLGWFFRAQILEMIQTSSRDAESVLYEDKDAENSDLNNAEADGSETDAEMATEMDETEEETE